MKKTLTVNLGGTVFHIDEDAYRLLDEYLNNLKLHFSKQEGAEEIINDIETRISELFIELNTQVININHVEEVIKRMGKPEEFDGGPEDVSSEEAEGGATPSSNKERGSSRRRLYRNPDDKLLGGVISGLCIYLGWNTTLFRLITLVALICGLGTLIPIYIVCWLVIPEANNAAEKLSMRGEEINMENIGKTVTDGFERVTNGVNDYMKSDKPRTFLQKLADAFGTVVGFLLKACLILVAVVCSPMLLVLAVVFVMLFVFVIAAAVGGGAALYTLMPAIDWATISSSPIVAIVACISGVVVVGIPLFAVIFSVLRAILNWRPMVAGLTITLLILWFVSLVVFCLTIPQFNWGHFCMNGILV